MAMPVARYSQARAMTVHGRLPVPPGVQIALLVQDAERA
jgi:hypothetical protein